MKSIVFAFPEGRRKALTMSYDDGVIEDRQLVAIFNKYDIKGTFHINGGSMNKERHIPAAEIAELYQGHEVSCHAYTHPFLERIPEIVALNQIFEDRKILEKYAGYPVRGMSYPFGTHNSQVREIAANAGIVYSRTTASTGKFSLPDNWLEWHPTSHHSHDVIAQSEVFKDSRNDFMLFYVWGHSYEFDRNNNWELIESFCANIARRDDIWYATNIEIYDYVNALRRLEFTATADMVHNPSFIPVWLKADGEIVKINGGATINL